MDRRFKVSPLVVCLERQTNPCLTQAAIGNKLGISRERVRQILKKNQLKTANARWGLTLICPRCGGKKKSDGQYCPRCLDELHWVDLECEVCGKLFQRRQYIVLAASERRGYKGHAYCSRQCFGKKVGKLCGWGRRRIRTYVTTA